MGRTTKWWAVLCAVGWLAPAQVVAQPPTLDGGVVLPADAGSPEDSSPALDAGVTEAASGAEAGDESPAGADGAAEIAPVGDTEEAGTAGAAGPDASLLYRLGDGRAAPAGDARGWQTAPGVEPEDVALLLPRFVLAIPRYAFELLFWPLRQLGRLVERHAIVAHIDNLIYWNDAKTVGLSPSVSFITGVGFTFGGDLFHDDLFGHDEALRLSGRYGGASAQGVELSFDASRFLGTRLWLEARARYEVNPSQVFAGVGVSDNHAVPMTPQGPRDSAVKTYFGQQRLLGLLRLGYSFGGPGDTLKVGMTGIVNRRDFNRNGVRRTQTRSIYDPARLVGFLDGTTTLELNANFVVDTRRHRGLDSTGTVFEVFGGPALPIDGYDFWHYGAELTGTINIYRHTRLLVLRGAIEAVHEEADQIPLSDLPRLGGSDRLRGYLEDQFRDETVALLSAEYHYPIHKNVLGTLFIDSGYAAPSYGELFALSDWKVGGGGGLIVGSDDGVTLRFELSYGDGLHLFVSSDLAAAFDGRSEQL